MIGRPVPDAAARARDWRQRKQEDRARRVLALLRDVAARDGLADLLDTFAAMRAADLHFLEERIQARRRRAVTRSKR